MATRRNTWRRPQPYFLARHLRESSRPTYLYKSEGGTKCRSPFGEDGVKTLERFAEAASFRADKAAKGLISLAMGGELCTLESVLQNMWNKMALELLRGCGMIRESKKRSLLGTAKVAHRMHAGSSGVLHNVGGCFSSTPCLSPLQRVRSTVDETTTSGLMNFGERACVLAG